MNDTVESVKVAIIGAGVAGLKAAQVLFNNKEAGLHRNDVIVLEAQDRIGGRIMTDKTSSQLGYTYDLGASWFHDSLSNPLLKELIDEGDRGVFDLEKDTYFNDRECVIYSSDHDGPLGSSYKLDKTQNEFEKYLEMYFMENVGADDMSLQEAYEKYAEERKAFLTKDQVSLTRAIMRYMELWHGIPWEKMSAKYALIGHEGRDLFNKKGYALVINKLLGQIPLERVFTKNAITKIKTNNKKGKRILIDTKNGKQVQSDYVIVTVPFSILALKEDDPHSIKWEPTLPLSIREGIEKVHFGALGKIIFEFDKVWWDETEDRFLVVGPESAKSDHSKPLTNLPEPFSYPMLVINFETMAKEKRCEGGALCILTQSPLTEYLEAHADEAWSYYGPMMKKLVKEGKEISSPINTVSSSWTSNPYALGSYCALYTNDEPLEFITSIAGADNLRGYPQGEVRFAGEHAIWDGAGCVNGAYTSGEREASAIINEIKSTL